MINSILKSYKEKKEEIEEKLKKFKNLNNEEIYQEFIFCLLTPQSNALRCWDAVKEISKLKNPSYEEINNILKTRTRFHNNKTNYVLQAPRKFNEILSQLNNPNKIQLRNYLAQTVKGYGLKEASHFLRNIGQSNNQIAILDRHILRNLKENKIIKIDKIKSKNHYIQLEKIFIKFTNKIKIPPDHLDLLFWSKETSFLFK